LHFQINKSGPGTVAQAYHPSNLGDRNGRIKVQIQPGKKVGEALSQRTRKMW
jgi:hypothetical protein